MFAKSSLSASVVYCLLAASSPHLSAAAAVEERDIQERQFDTALDSITAAAGSAFTQATAAGLSLASGAAAGGTVVTTVDGHAATIVTIGTKGFTLASGTPVVTTVDGYTFTEIVGVTSAPSSGSNGGGSPAASGSNAAGSPDSAATAGATQSHNAAAGMHAFALSGPLLGGLATAFTGIALGAWVAL